MAKASCNFSEYNWQTGKYDFTPQKPVYEMYLKIKKDGSYFPGADNIDNDMARAQFSQGKIGMKFGASYDVGVYNDQFPAKCDWGVAPMPTANVNERYKSLNSSNGFLVINKKAIDNLGEELALKLFKWFHDDDMMAELYRQGVEIPTKPEIIEKVKLDNPKHGWLEFAALVDSSTVLSWNVPQSLRSGKQTSMQYFLNDIWPEKRSVDEVLDELTDSYNEGVQKWLSDYPDKKLENYIDPSFNTKME